MLDDFFGGRVVAEPVAVVVPEELIDVEPPTTFNRIRALSFLFWEVGARRLEGARDAQMSDETADVLS